MRTVEEIVDWLFDFSNGYTLDGPLPLDDEAKDWDPAKHPRGGNPANPGEFSEAPGGSEPKLDPQQVPAMNNISMRVPLGEGEYVYRGERDTRAVVANEAESDAFAAWVDGGYWTINSVARGKEQAHEYDEALTAERIAALSVVVARNQIAEGAVVYRGLHDFDGSFAEALGKSAVLTDRGFSAWSTEPDQITSFTGLKPETTVVMRLKLDPSAHRVAYFDGREEEYLMARGAAYRAVGAIGKDRIVDVVVEPRGVTRALVPAVPSEPPRSRFIGESSDFEELRERKDWDPDKHPRGGNPANPGQFSASPGGGEAPSDNPWPEFAEWSDAKEARRNQLEASIQGLLPRGSMVWITRHPAALQVAETTRDVLAEMKGAGYKMPRGVGIVTEKDSRNVNAETVPEGRGRRLQIYIPDSLPPEASVDRIIHAYYQERNGPEYFAVRNMRDMVVHEMGHVLAGPYIAEDDGANGFGSEANRATARTVSRYAGKEANEFVAEAFVRLYRGEYLTRAAQKLYNEFHGPKVK